MSQDAEAAANPADDGFRPMRESGRIVSECLAKLGGSIKLSAVTASGPVFDIKLPMNETVTLRVGQALLRLSGDEAGVNVHVVSENSVSGNPVAMMRVGEAGIASAALSFHSS